MSSELPQRIPYISRLARSHKLSSTPLLFSYSACGCALFCGWVRAIPATTTVRVHSANTVFPRCGPLYSAIGSARTVFALCGARAVTCAVTDPSQLFQARKLYRPAAFSPARSLPKWYLLRQRCETAIADRVDQMDKIRHFN